MASHTKAKTLPRLIALGGIAAFVLVASGSGCNGSAVGVQACQTIEEQRCDLAPKCAAHGGPKITSTTEISNCKILYRDHCRVGIENTAKEPSKDMIDGCVNALKLTIACQDQGQATMATCTDSLGVSLADGMTQAATPCWAFLNPEHLTACAFLASSSSTTSATTGAGGGSGG